MAMDKQMLTLILEEGAETPCLKENQMRTYGALTGIIAAALPGTRRSFHAWALSCAAILVLGMLTSVEISGPIRSVGAMTFVNADTLVIADWRAGELHAVVDAVLPLTQASAAYTGEVEQRRGRGKLVVAVPPYHGSR